MMTTAIALCCYLLVALNNNRKPPPCFTINHNASIHDVKGNREVLSQVGIFLVLRELMNNEYV